MLVIRTEQLQAFQKKLDEQFAERVISFLLDSHSDECAGLSHREMRERVADGLAAARRFGIVSESGLADFITRQFVIGPKYYLHPAVKALFDTWPADPETALAVMTVTLSSKQLREAAEVR